MVTKFLSILILLYTLKEMVSDLVSLSCTNEALPWTWSFFNLKKKYFLGNRTTLKLIF